MDGFGSAAQPLNGSARWLSGSPRQAQFGRDEWLVAARSIQGPVFQRPGNDGAWVGHIAFDFPEALDRVQSRFPCGPLAASSWWEPELLLMLRSGLLDVLMDKAVRPASEVGTDLRARPGASPTRMNSATLTPRTTKAEYLASIEKLLGHIQRGDIYEVNYCTERTALLAGFDPFEAFGRLVERTNAPYAALFYRCKDVFALCMSPEHFLRIDGRRVSTRPMKGTRPRSNPVIRAVDAALVYGCPRPERAQREHHGRGRGAP